MKRRDFIKQHKKKQTLIISSIILAVLVVLGVVTFALMPKNQDSTTQSSLESSSNQIEQSTNQTTTSTTQNEKRVSINDLTSKMDIFMKSFSSQMGQYYKQYYPSKTNSTKFYGFDFINDLDLYNFVVDGSPASIGFLNLNTWRGTSDYNILMIYSDVEYKSTTYTDRHLYLFTLHNNNPEVLVATQNQSQSGTIYFNHTQNMTLKNGFTNLINNK